MAKTKIEWATDTWNPVTGCDKVSQGCKNCYAEREWKRLSTIPGSIYFGRKFTDVQMHRHRLTQPLRWTKPRRVFVNSMSDLFHDDVSWEFIDAVFAVMAVTARHTYQLLTKRPKRMRAYLEHLQRECENLPIPFPDRIAHRAAEFCGPGSDNCGPHWPLQNVWLGVSAEDQASAGERIAALLRLAWPVRWVSTEPLLGEINLVHAAHPECQHEAGYMEPETGAWICNECEKETDIGVDWVVAGGESGPDARITHPSWIRSLRDQCAAAGVPLFLKQITERGRKVPIENWPNDMRIREYPNA